MKISFSHLKDVNQTYTEHMKDALSIFTKLIKASGAILAHAVYPDVYQDYATNVCKEIYEESIKKRENAQNNESVSLLNPENETQTQTTNENINNEKKDN